MKLRKYSHVSESITIKLLRTCQIHIANIRRRPICVAMKPWSHTRVPRFLFRPVWLSSPSSSLSTCFRLFRDTETDMTMKAGKKHLPTKLMCVRQPLNDWLPQLLKCREGIVRKLRHLTFGYFQPQLSPMAQVWYGDYELYGMSRGVLHGRPRTRFFNNAAEICATTAKINKCHPS